MIAARAGSIEQAIVAEMMKSAWTRVVEYLRMEILALGTFNNHSGAGRVRCT